MSPFKNAGGTATSNQLAASARNAGKIPLNSLRHPPTLRRHAGAGCPTVRGAGVGGRRMGRSSSWDSGASSAMDEGLDDVMEILRRCMIGALRRARPWDVRLFFRMPLDPQLGAAAPPHAARMLRSALRAVIGAAPAGSALTVDVADLTPEHAGADDGDAEAVLAGGRDG